MGVLLGVLQQDAPEEMLVKRGPGGAERKPFLGLFAKEQEKRKERQERKQRDEKNEERRKKEEEKWDENKKQKGSEWKSAEHEDTNTRPNPYGGTIIDGAERWVPWMEGGKVGGRGCTIGKVTVSRAKDSNFGHMVLVFVGDVGAKQELRSEGNRKQSIGARSWKRC